ncbi:MAG: NAD(P)-binding protein [Chloroflexales bacterium]|nr:NAD(P)-binding protein [Chloroflexales bacterium]
MAQIAIIGAGVAGLAAGRELVRSGHSVTIFEKSGSAGGRVATQRVGGFAIDHGAQLVKAPTGRLQTLVEETGEADDLLGPVWIFDGDGRVNPGDPVFNVEPKWVWPGGNTALSRHLSRGLNIHLETAVATLRRAGTGYEVLDDGGGVEGAFAAVLLTAPAPQSAAILAASDIEASTRAELLAALAPARYRRCLSVALAYARRPELPWYAMVNIDRRHPIAWLACEHDKAGRAPHGHALLLAQMGPTWSEAHWEDLAKGTYGLGAAPLPEAAIEAHDLALALVGEDLGEPLWADAHRWRYALCDAPCGAAALEGRDGLYLAGDMERGQGRVHLAIESGWAAARRIMASLGREVYA